MTAILVKSIIAKNELVNKMSSTIKKINSQDKGVTAVEYALIIGLIAIVIIGAVTLLGESISDIFAKSRCSIENGTWTESTSTCSK